MRIEVLDHGYVSLVESWGSDQAIIEGARMSTGKGFNGWGPMHSKGCEFAAEGSPKQSFGGCCAGKPGDEKLLRYLWEHKHSTPFEMGGLTVEAQAPIFVFREWHRHRVPFGYSEASARYAPLPDLNYIPTVERLMTGGGHLTKQAGTVKGASQLTEAAAERFRQLVDLHYTRSQSLYEEALEDGVPKELARIILPVGRYSKHRATANLRGWLGFLSLRMAPNAQYEIRVYAEAIGEMVKAKFPRTWELFAEGLNA